MKALLAFVAAMTLGAFSLLAADRQEANSGKIAEAVGRVRSAQLHSTETEPHK